eukprot:1844683-Pyramimonas_sp.AAC.1
MAALHNNVKTLHTTVCGLCEHANYLQKKVETLEQELRARDQERDPEIESAIKKFDEEATARVQKAMQEANVLETSAKKQPQ